MKIFLHLSVIAFLFFACNKNTSGPAQPGTIKGSVSDTSAVVRLIIISSDGSYFKEIENLTDNNFQLTDLAPGNYTIKVIPKLGYSVTASAQVTIHNGETEDAGMFTLTTNGQPKGSLHFNFYNDLYNTTDTVFYFTDTAVKCAYINDTLFITATQPPTYPYWRFVLNIGGVVATGTYNFNSLKRDSYIDAYKLYANHTTSWFSTRGYNNDYNFGGSGTVNVTTLDTANHIISGTFFGDLLNMPFSGSNNPLTDGSFQLNY